MKKILLGLFLLTLLLTGCKEAETVPVIIVPVPPIEYDVNFNANGGTFIEGTVVESGSSIDKPEDPIKDGYLFLGWSHDLNTEISLFPFIVIRDITFNAEWEYLEPVYFDVSFETNGGTSVSSSSILEGDSIYYPSSVPTKEGYIFGGWYSNIELTDNYSFPGKVTEDLTFYAMWLNNYIDHLSNDNPLVTIVVKDMGTITLELFPSIAPNTVNNFIMYIQSGDFTNNTFHRVIEDFMIQGGNTNSTLCPINGDFSENGFTNDLLHSRGVISMARTSVMNSATSQFFIVHEDSYFLDGNYATFGGVVTGFEVLDAIALVDTNLYDAPLVSVIIQSMTVDLNGYVVVDRVCAN